MSIPATYEDYLKVVHYVEQYLIDHNWLSVDIERVEEKRSMMRCDLQMACPTLYNAISDAIDDYCTDNGTDIDNLSQICSTDPDDYYMDVFQGF